MSWNKLPADPPRSRHADCNAFVLAKSGTGKRTERGTLVKTKPTIHPSSQEENCRWATRIGTALPGTAAAGAACLPLSLTLEEKKATGPWLFARTGDFAPS